MADVSFEAPVVQNPQAQTPRRGNSMNTARTTTPSQSLSASGHDRVAPSPLPATSTTATTSAKRVYRAADNKWVTRDIASLDFLLGIPLAAEQEIVATGWQLQVQRDQEDPSDSHSEYQEEHVPLTEIIPATAKGTWFEKWIKPDSRHAFSRSSPKKSNSNHGEAAGELERPTQADASAAKHPFAVPMSYAPGRRLEGDEAVRIQIPLTTDTVTKQRSIARQAALREWELQTAHGLAENPPLLDGRIFFSADSSYPVSVFSVIRYEPKKEEAAIRRRKLEAIGGGGSQFVIPVRDWRGISYRALLPRTSDEKGDKTFNRFVRDSDDDDDDSSTSSASSDISDTYVPGILDDPDMVLGRHRTVMIGDRVTGPIVSSTIQFVKPTLLKAELNKQFRERFDGWEPPKSQRKYIGAKVIQGNYVLIDPTEDYDEQSYERRSRKGSVGSAGEKTEEKKTLRIPPSLTLSKIRSLKQQALQAAVKAKLEIATVALACVYFERLCLDCRVDKSNRRLCFAACLLLASKLNEPNVDLVMCQDDAAAEGGNSDDDMIASLHAFARPNKRSNKMFASLLLFFTQEWSLSLKNLFHAEWGVFAALGFSLHARPSHIAFHFKRLMRTLEWNPRDYLGQTMYNQWMDALKDEENGRIKRERRKEERRKRKEEQLLNLHIEIENEVLRRKTEIRNASSNSHSDEGSRMKPEGGATAKSDTELIPSTGTITKKKTGTDRRLKLFNRFALRRSTSQERLHNDEAEERRVSETTHGATRRRSTGAGLPRSPSMPTIATAFSETGIVAIDIPADIFHSDASTLGSQNCSYKDDISV